MQTVRLYSYIQGNLRFLISTLPDYSIFCRKEYVYVVLGRGHLFTNQHHVPAYLRGFVKGYASGLENLS